MGTTILQMIRSLHAAVRSVPIPVNALKASAFPQPATLFGTEPNKAVE